MHTEESMTVGVYTDAAIRRLKEYLLSTPAHNASIELHGDLLYVAFEDEYSPSTEIIEKARQIFYWSDTLTIPHIDGFVHYYSETNFMLINLVHYEDINKICDKLKSFGAELKGFDLNFHEYTFTYDIPSRSNLRYDELLEIEQIVDPKETESLEHLSVFRMDKFYTLTIKHVSWKN